MANTTTKVNRFIALGYLQTIPGLDYMKNGFGTSNLETGEDQSFNMSNQVLITMTQTNSHRLGV